MSSHPPLTQLAYYVGFINPPPNTVVTTVLEQDLFFSSYSRSVFLKPDELLTLDAETKIRLQSVMVAGCGPALQGRARVGDRPVGHSTHWKQADQSDKVNTFFYILTNLTWLPPCKQPNVVHSPRHGQKQYLCGPDTLPACHCNGLYPLGTALLARTSGPLGDS